MRVREGTGGGMEKTGNTVERKAKQTRRSIHTATRRNTIKTITADRTVMYSARPRVYDKSNAYLCCKR